MTALADLITGAATRQRTPATRLDGWTPDRQRAFLTAIAEGHTVEAACRLVGLTHQSAYAFRNRAAGATFALGWQAASLLARNRIADVLVARALDGQVETITRPDGATISRHRYDNRLAAAMLTRLDRLADAQVGEGTHHAARLVAQEFDAFLDLVEHDAGPARAGLFLGVRAAREATDADLAPIVALARADRWCRTGAALADEVSVADLDPADRAGWTAEQWQRAEAAGLVAFSAPATKGNGNPQLPQLRPGAAGAEPTPPEEDMGDYYAEWCDVTQRYRTNFPPPPDFDGEEQREFGDEMYERDLSADELRIVEAWDAEDIAEERERGRRLAHVFFYGSPQAPAADATSQATSDAAPDVTDTPPP